MGWRLPLEGLQRSAQRAALVLLPGGQAESQLEERGHHVPFERTGRDRTGDVEIAVGGGQPVGEQRQLDGGRAAKVRNGLGCVAQSR